MVKHHLLLSASGSKLDPIAKLPVELVCKIFEEYVLSRENDCNDPNSWYFLDGNEGHKRPSHFPVIAHCIPLRLGAVSRRWRMIAWSYPRLWANLLVPIMTSGYKHGPEMVRQWLARTGRQPLRIRIVITSWDMPDDMKETLPYLRVARGIMTALNEVSSRWRSLDLSTCPLNLVNLLRGDLDNSRFPAGAMLEHLSIGSLFAYDDHRCCTWPWPCCAFLHNSTRSWQYRPTHLDIQSPIHPTGINIDWSNLTYVYLEHMSRSKCFDILTHLSAHSPVLTHLTLRGICDELRSDERWQPPFGIEFSTVRSLYLDDDDSDERAMTTFLNVLTLPELRSLTYRGDTEGGSSSWPEAAALSFVKRTRGLIEDFTFYDPVDIVSRGALASILRHMPTLRRLSIELLDESEEEQTTSLYKALAQASLKGNNKTDFLPLLERLDLQLWMGPSDCSSFIGMFAENPSLTGTDFAPTSPLRRALQVKYAITGWNAPATQYLDATSLWQLVLLWKKYGFYCVFTYNFSSCHRDSDHFLIESYRHALSSACPKPADFESIYSCLEEMTKLSF